MNRTEIYKELQMTYEELQKYLKEKYGGAVCDYFATPECRSKSKKISRTKEGLYCHHIDEDKGVNLANSEHAKIQPFEWQRKDRLVYCNILEHLILHIKISIIRQKDYLESPRDVSGFFTTGGIFMICEELNDMFMNNGTSVAWKKRCFEEIKNNYKDYIVLIKSLLCYIDINYRGAKSNSAFLSPGSKVHFSDFDCEILKLNKARDVFVLKLPTGEEKTLKSEIAISQFKYEDYINKVTVRMSSSYDTFYEKIFEDIINCNKKSDIDSCVTHFKIDYTGRGYAQYKNIVLGNEYGSKDADNYISKALPMFCDSTYQLEGKNIEFWKDSEIPLTAWNSFFIVRVETMFTIKKGNEPFVRYRERDLLRNTNIFTQPLTRENNFKDIGWTILSTSDIYDKNTNNYYSKYYNQKRELVDATVILTLGKDDYILFREKYDIRYLKILDGCYFC